MLHLTITYISRSLAVLGGLVLCGVVIMTVLSVLGRELNSFAQSAEVSESLPFFSELIVALGISSITGDYEIASALNAFIVFSFLPLCQLASGHAYIAILSDSLPKKLQRWIICVWELVLCMFILIICYKLFDGLIAKYNFQETSFLLQFPLWWSYAASFVAACVACLVAVYCSCVRVLEALYNKQILPHSATSTPS